MHGKRSSYRDTELDGVSEVAPHPNIRGDGVATARPNQITNGGFLFGAGRKLNGPGYLDPDCQRGGVGRFGVCGDPDVYI